MIRLAAVGDVHLGLEPDPVLAGDLASVHECADVLLLAGDLTRHGDPAEAAVLADALRPVQVPVVAVLGNHDHHSDRSDEVAARLTDAGAVVLEGDGTVLDVAGTRVGIAGVKGFGGGFAGASGSEFGEPEMKAFIAHTRVIAEGLHNALADLDAETRVALLHYAPVEETLRGERLEIFPFLGSYLLAEAIDRAGADLALHGHAHAGSERGITPGGVPVRNVARPLIGCSFRVYELAAPTSRQGRLQLTV